MKKLHYYLLSFLAILGFILLNSGDTFATSPSYTLSSQPSSNIYLCNNGDPSTSVLSISCSDYLYVNAEVTGTATARLQLFSNTNYNYPITSTTLSTFSAKLSSVNSVLISTNGTDMSGGGSITFSFSDTPIGSSGIVPSGSLSITENGTYDVTNYASAVVNVDNETTIEVIEDPISNDFQKVFFAIVERIIPAFGVLLVVWFGIDMLSSLIFGRGR